MKAKMTNLKKEVKNDLYKEFFEISMSMQTIKKGYSGMQYDIATRELEKFQSRLNEIEKEINKK